MNSPCTFKHAVACRNQRMDYSRGSFRGERPDPVASAEVQSPALRGGEGLTFGQWRAGVFSSCEATSPDQVMQLSVPVCQSPRVMKSREKNQESTPCPSIYAVRHARGINAVAVEKVRV
jgi:hypothetical protein